MGIGNFCKQPLNAKEQIDLLRLRDMEINDESFAIECLHNIGYYRLSGYWFKFQNKWNNANNRLSSDELENFSSKVLFEDIVNIYRFDTKIRSLFLDALEKIEISIGSHMCDYMCLNYGSFWYTDSKYFENKKLQFSDIKIEIDNFIEKNKDKPSLINFFDKYQDEYPPFWMIVPLLSFGTISKIYEKLRFVDRKNIADKFKMNEIFMTSSLKCLTNIRNICAHYSRLWDKPIKVRSMNVNFATKLSKFNTSFNIDGTDNALLYVPFYIVSLYLCIIAPNSKFCTLIKNTIDRYNTQTHGRVSYRIIGFPHRWEYLPLFTKMLKN